MRVKKIKISQDENISIQNLNLDTISDLNVGISKNPSMLEDNEVTSNIYNFSCHKVVFEFLEPIQIINYLPFDISLFFSKNILISEEETKIMDESKMISEGSS